MRQFSTATVRFIPSPVVAFFFARLQGFPLYSVYVSLFWVAKELFCFVITWTTSLLSVPWERLFFVIIIFPMPFLAYFKIFRHFFHHQYFYHFVTVIVWYIDTFISWKWPELSFVWHRTSRRIKPMSGGTDENRWTAEPLIFAYRCDGFSTVKQSRYRSIIWIINAKFSADILTYFSYFLFFIKQALTFMQIVSEDCNDFQTNADTVQ